MIEKYILSNSGTKDDAQDVFQNALVVLYSNTQKPSFELTSSISTYIFSISKNLWLKELRRKKNDSDKPLSENIIQEEGDFPQKEALISKVEKALNALSENCKRLIELYHYQNFSWKEIVVKMNYKNEHAARNQKYKCLKKLKDKLI